MFSSVFILSEQWTCSCLRTHPVLQAEVRSLSCFPIQIGSHSQPYEEMQSLPFSASLPLLIFHCSALPVISSVCILCSQAVKLCQGKFFTRLLFHFSTNSCYIISLYPYLVPCQSFCFYLLLVLQVPFSAVSGLQLHMRVLRSSRAFALPLLWDCPPALF